MSTLAPLPEPMFSHSQIADRAYEIWLKEGRPKDRELDHWLEAERQIRHGKGLHDDARRFATEPIDPADPAASEAAEIDEEIGHMAGEPSRCSPTSIP